MYLEYEFDLFGIHSFEKLVTSYITPISLIVGGTGNSRSSLTMRVFGKTKREYPSEIAGATEGSVN